MATPVAQSRNAFQYRVLEQVCGVEEARHNVSRHLRENVERSEVVPEVPKGGLDVHTVPVYWVLTCSRSVILMESLERTRAEQYATLVTALRVTVFVQSFFFP